MSISERFLYVHIPKTGGVSFRQILIDAFPADRVIHIAPGPKIVEHTTESLAGFDVVHGHFHLGHLNHLKGFKRLVTLRDPVARCISAYNFWRALDPSDPRWDDNARLMITASQTCTLDQILEHENPRVRSAFANKQVRLMSGEVRELAPLSADHLVRAIGALVGFDFVGLNEELSLSKAIFCHKFGFYCAGLDRRLNESRLRLDASEKTLNRLRAANHLDLRLIQFIRERGLFALNKVPYPRV
jgi:hypothetical protein